MTTGRYVRQPLPVDIEISTQGGTLKTLEGFVPYQSGDALVSGIKGERWPVPIDTLRAFYTPIPPTRMGESGQYLRKANHVKAHRLDKAKAIKTSTGATLHGKKGDWLVEYGPGDHAVVREDIFESTYAPVHDQTIEAAADVIDGPPGADRVVHYERAYLPVVIGIAAADSAGRLVHELLRVLSHEFPNTDWVIVHADGEHSVSIACQPVGGPLDEHEKLDPTKINERGTEEHLKRNPQMNKLPVSMGEASAIYLLRTCSLVFFVEGEHQPSEKLLHWLHEHKALLPLDTPSAGGKVSVFSLPEPAPQMDISTAHAMSDLADWSQLAKAQAERNWWATVKSFFLRVDKKREADDSEGRMPEKIREVLGQWARVDRFNLDAKSFLANYRQREPIDRESPLGLRLMAFNRKSASDEPRNDLHMLNRTFIAADRLANIERLKWHKLLINDLRRLARFKVFRALGWPRLFSMFSLTIIAALFLALATEFSEGGKSVEHLVSERFANVPGALCFLLYTSALGYGFYRLVRHRVLRVESRHQDYRLLAEGLRIQFFWSAMAPYCSEAFNEMRSYVADHIPIARRGSIFWVRGALHAIRFAYPPPHSEQTNDWAATKNEWDAIDPCLIAHQLNYERHVLINRRKQALRCLNKWSRTWLWIFLFCFAALVVRSIIQIAVPFLPGVSEILDDVLAWLNHVLEAFALLKVVPFLEIFPFQKLLSITMVVSLVISLAAHDIAENLGLEAEIRRGESTSSILYSAQKHWQSGQLELDPSNEDFKKNIETREQLLFEMGRLLIDDYSDWFNIHRERPTQPVTGG